MMIHLFRKQLAIFLAGAAMAAMLLTGCQSSKSEESKNSAAANSSPSATMPRTTENPVVNVAQDEKECVHVDVPHVTVSLGYVEPGQGRSFVVQIHNPSDHTIAIKHVRSECRCLMFCDTPTELSPGINELAMVFEDAPGESGGTFYSKRVTLEPADSTIAPFVITVTAAVGIPLEFQGNDVQINDVEQLPSVTLMNHSGEDVRVNYSTTTLPGILASISHDNVVPAGGSLSVPLKHISEDATSPARGATIRGTVLIHTDSERQPIVSVPVAWNGEMP